MVTTESSIILQNLSTLNVNQKIITARHVTVGAAYDCEEKRIVWIEFESQQSSDYDTFPGEPNIQQ